MNALALPPQPTRLDLATEFETLSDTALEQVLPFAVIDCGGTYIPAGAGGHWGPLEHELTLLGVTGTGDTLASAGRNWTRHALRLERNIQPGTTSRQSERTQQ